ncbi:TetR/AcrR family transcriptional regulator [Streptomyces kanamyceticus]|uniref:TetR/AcrR family transcriptional regulator n=1 Tax=Streptomyces kanamyceticus TaxID=1967 RepID=UPI0037DC8E8E
MPKGPTKRRPQTTARLLHAALEVFAERGFYGSSIEVICERAGLTRGAFYSNYRTKEGLFFALFELHAERVIDRLTRALDELDTADDPLRAVLTRMNTVDETERRWYLLSTEFTLHAIRHPDTARVLADHDRRLREEIVRLLAHLFDRLGRTPSVDLDLLARLTTAVHEGSLAQSLVEPDRLPPEQLAVTFLPALLDTVSEPATTES